MNITVTIGASPEFLNAIQDLAKAFTGAKSPAVVTGKRTERNVKQEDSKPEVAAAPAAEMSPAIPEATEKPVTIEQLRALVQKKAGTKKAEIKGLLSEYQTDSVTNLSKEYYSEFKEKIDAL
jgi:hypothetical protein